ncbi:hypothetical protein B0H14DRAFT_2658809 [Mycena olivaceomarginata]|nr:hypothetical protein B0H14DRAFT_2658809 [Mycena olivaceomarginata]
MNTYEAVRESVKIRLYCDTMLIDAVPIEEVEREISDLYARGLGLVHLTTQPEVDEVEDAVDIGVGGFEGGAVLLLKGWCSQRTDERGIVLDTGRRGRGQVGGGSCNIDWIRKFELLARFAIGGREARKGDGMENSPHRVEMCWETKGWNASKILRMIVHRVTIEIGSSTGAQTQSPCPSTSARSGDVDVDVETDVEGPGAEEGDGWSLRFAGVNWSRRVLVELQRFVVVVADMLNRY